MYGCAAAGPDLVGDGSLLPGVGTGGGPWSGCQGPVQCSRTGPASGDEVEFGVYGGVINAIFLPQEEGSFYFLTVEYIMDHYMNYDYNESKLDRGKIP